jgi:hypothetical protein
MRFMEWAARGEGDRHAAMPKPIRMVPSTTRARRRRERRSRVVPRPGPRRRLAVGRALDEGTIPDGHDPEVAVAIPSG